MGSRLGPESMGLRGLELRADGFHLQEMPWARNAKIGAWGQCANMGALIIRIGFSGPLYYTCNKEPRKIELVII